MSSGSDDAGGSAGSTGAERSLNLPAELLQELVRHAQGSLPEECCGILIGSQTGSDRARVHHVIPVENASTPQGRKNEYLVAPLAILAAQRRAREDGLEIVGYYHSHPSGSALPSALDRRNAWPDTCYVILGMRGGKLAEAKSWRLGPGDVEFVEETLNCDHDEK